MNNGTRNTTPLAVIYCWQSKLFVMDFKKLLSDSREEQLKADHVVEKLVKSICQMAKEKTFKKYEFNKITRNEMQFELLGVKSNFYPWSADNEKVRIWLIFTICSKLPKERREKLELFKERFKKESYVPWKSYFKTPIWVELFYIVELDDILNDTINLKVE